MKLEANSAVGGGKARNLPPFFLLVAITISVQCSNGNTASPGAAEYLAQSSWPMVHHSPGQDAASPEFGPAGLPTAKWHRNVVGPGTVLLASDGSTMLKGVDMVGRRHVFYRTKLEGGSLLILSKYDLEIDNPMSGLYTLLDFENCWWSFTLQTVHRLCPGESGIEEVLTLDLLTLHSGLIEATDQIVGMNVLPAAPGLLDLAVATSGLVPVRDGGT